MSIKGKWCYFITLFLILFGIAFSIQKNHVFQDEKQQTIRQSDQKMKQIYLSAYAYGRKPVIRGYYRGHHHNTGSGHSGFDHTDLLFLYWYFVGIATFALWGSTETWRGYFCSLSWIWGIGFFVLIIGSIVTKEPAWWSIFISLGLWILFAILHENAKEKEQKKE